MRKQVIAQVLAALEATYPQAQCALEFQSPYQLLISTILSAQCTDKQVNKITRVLFRHYADAAAFAALEPEQLEPFIHSCGFFRAKAKNIVQTSRALMTQYGGQVPDTMEALLTLPGVGRKTANVVLANAFGQDAIAVDTHVFRVANRIGLAHAKTPEQVEQQLMRRIPKGQWSAAHHWLIWHGRTLCIARRPRCAQCPLVAWCEYEPKNL